MFKNKEEELGALDTSYHYPNNQSIRIYSSLRNVDDWETKGGLIQDKLDYPLLLHRSTTSMLLPLVENEKLMTKIRL